MATILTNWTFWRALRLVAGLYTVAFAVYNNEWTIAAVGGVYALMALLNTGCAAGACAVPVNVQNNKRPGSTQEVIFEEIKPE